MKEILTDIMIETMKENSINNFGLKYINKDDFIYVSDAGIQPILCGFDILGFKTCDQITDVKDSIEKMLLTKSHSNPDFEHVKLIDYGQTYKPYRSTPRTPFRVIFLFVYE
jgi:hypothetical protein